VEFGKGFNPGGLKSMENGKFLICVRAAFGIGGRTDEF